MMSDKRAVKVGDHILYWELDDDKYTGCEFKKTGVPTELEITKVPDPKPKAPDEPMTRGSVVTIEGDDEFIAVRFTAAGYIPYPFVAHSSHTGEPDLSSWGEIVSRASGRKIIVHKMVDPTKVPLAVETYGEWLEIPRDERKKYKWRDVEGDVWKYDTSRGIFIPEGEQYAHDFGFDVTDYFPLIRNEKIG